MGDANQGLSVRVRRGERGFTLVLFALTLVTMMVFAEDKRRARRDDWRISENTLVYLVTLGGLLFDDRVLTGAPIWLKPFRFGVSTAVYAITLAWLLSYVVHRPRLATAAGTVFSVMLIAPSWGGMVNGLLTLRGAWDRVRQDPVLKFMVVGVTAYGMSTFEGPLLSVKSVNALSHYTDWTIAHVHAGALGWVGFLTFGMMYWLVPRLFQTPLWSRKAAETHFWIGTVGILLYVVTIYAAGLTQGLMWRAVAPDGTLTYAFSESVKATYPFYTVRLLGGLLFGVSPFDPEIYLVVPLVLAGTSLLACWLPARRASRLNPIVALRED